MKDSDGKKVMFGWSDALHIVNRNWLRAAPQKRQQSLGMEPSLKQIGAEKNPTKPDGLYVSFYLRDQHSRQPSFCDVVVIEVSSNRSNLHDKRSRYAGLGSGILLRTTKKWWNNPLNTGKTRAENENFKPERQILTKTTDPSRNENNNFFTPVRVTRVLYVVSDREEKSWRTNSVLGAHEYMITEEDFETWKDPQISKFIEETSHLRQFRSRRDS